MISRNARIGIVVALGAGCAALEFLYLVASADTWSAILRCLILAISAISVIAIMGVVSAALVHVATKASAARRNKMDLAWGKYRDSLDDLRRSPSDAYLKAEAYQRGRNYFEVVQKEVGRRITDGDEIRLKNDVEMASVGALTPRTRQPMGCDRVDESADNRLGAISLLLSCAGGGAVAMAAISPLLFVNSYLVPAFFFGVAGIGTGITNRRISGLTLAGVAVGVVVLFGCISLWAEASLQWQGIGARLRRF